MNSENTIRITLLDAMSDISEKVFNDPWMDNLEHFLWLSINELENKDRIEVEHELVDKVTLLNLKALAKELNGWWIWPNNKPIFLDMNTWLEKYNKDISING